MKALVPLGDQAALAYFEDENSALCFAASVRAAQPPWLLDVVSSYRSAAVFFDLAIASFPRVSEELRHLAQQSPTQVEQSSRLHHIPCCYELALDLERIVQHTRRPADAIVQLHANREYTVYAIGFCPGFPYLGYLTEELCNVPRLPSPRVRVEPGSIGLTGRQTGIYTEPRPGGWNIVGRTPLVLVDVAEGFFPIRTGDRVRFESIDRAAFERLQGKRL